tara:strand:+ start:158 stop:358 length:201 start_codon:yes stop_codon:yes gene_type:complete
MSRKQIIGFVGVAAYGGHTVIGGVSALQLTKKRSGEEETTFTSEDPVAIVNILLLNWSFSTLEFYP